MAAAFSEDMIRRQPVSATADHAEERTNPAARLGFEPGQVVQEIGYDDDVELELREGIEATTGQELVDEEYDDVADVVLLWFRDEDGDLTDALVDAIGLIEDGGTVWLMTPKTGRDGYVEPSDINEAAQTAGLAQTKSISAGKDWTGSRLVTPKGAKAKR
ncbi:conserved hypothetical protein [Streptomyces griseus subsp. griseus NBRC 13350]|uniref:DUF3052 domain containing protein n=1 Tax=Streptomyces griseus subsp. griseus (strain JCM 4626 / CBS 651.72 / NBRC 13350 / KCC S-0626 / ISP 5235) TaxID=455632 RepID=B1VYH5_STRGG|nr:conserved hypothetical protein [Streptomyces griseus subsp. griseus NBRC 13350]